MHQNSNSLQRLNTLRKEIVEGLLYTHARLSENTKTTLETSAFLYGLIEMLDEKGLLSIDALDERKREVTARLLKRNKRKGVGVLLQEPEYDKYAFKGVAEIDCQKRVHFCKAACCRLPFALSKQDIREGIVHWDLGQPYIIAQKLDGYCIHLDKKSWCCSVRKQRPVPCRAYDCSKNQDIWLDFKDMVVNPDIFRDEWPRCVSANNGGNGAT